MDVQVLLLQLKSFVPHWVFLLQMESHVDHISNQIAEIQLIASVLMELIVTTTNFVLEMELDATIH